MTAVGVNQRGRENTRIQCRRGNRGEEQEGSEVEDGSGRGHRGIGQERGIPEEDEDGSGRRDWVEKKGQGGERRTTKLQHTSR